MASAVRILVVDDEPDVREALATLLETFLDGAEVRQAGSGGEGLRLLRDAGADLILTDFRMPGMDGAQFLAAAAKVAPGTPHILVTAYDKEAVENLGAGSVPIVHKPFEPTDLLAAVDRALGTASAA